MPLGAARSSGPTARFDDLVEDVALVFDGGPVDVLVADRPVDVRPVLQAVEAATAAGKWAYGFVSYEAAPGLDPGLAVHRRRLADLPLAWFAIASAPRLAPTAAASGESGTAYQVGDWQRNWTSNSHRDDVERIRTAIAAGETYQCNLTVRMQSQVDGDFDALYTDLVAAQQSRYCARIDTDRHAVLSASPELFFEWAGDRVLTRPMKGTARRGRTTAEDGRAREALRTSAKERAENLMIVDLLRNDLGRIAEVGTVRVPALWTAERYETVWQLTSDVIAQVRPDVGLDSIFAALFPSGSVTGAPKQRTMELITELEPEPRGVYCGAIGLVAPPGAAPFRARFNVAIRTVVIDRASHTAWYGTGGGITWDSEPAAEHAELLAKTEVLRRPPGSFGLIETMAREPSGDVRNLDEHLARLADSAAYFGFPNDPTEVRSELARQLGALPSGTAYRIRLVLDRSGHCSITVQDLPPTEDRPVRLALDRTPVDSASPFLVHKTTHRAIYADRMARHPDHDDVLLLNERGELTETTIANLAVCLDGQWYTPPVSAGCLPGVERGRRLRDGSLIERVLRPADLRRAEAIAVLSSLRGWRPAAIDDDQLT
jgi:para-aminobenzoate synthetase/4-amino-4-deoxychorismate lyase